MAALGFIDYFKVAEHGREFLRSDLWEFKFISPPSGIYMPPEETLSIRCSDFGIQIDNSINRIEARLGGFTIYQPTESNRADGTFSMRFVDREDMSIQHMFGSWANKIMEKQTKKTGRKADLTATVQMIQYNTHRQPVKILTFYGCFPNTASDMAESNFNREAMLVGEYDIDFTFEYYNREIIPAQL